MNPNNMRGLQFLMATDWSDDLEKVLAGMVNDDTTQIRLDVSKYLNHAISELGKRGLSLDRDGDKIWKYIQDTLSMALYMTPWPFYKYEWSSDLLTLTIFLKA